ncbi:MAG: isochorismatase family protein [Rhizobiales bacterium]|jgi:ureidoacrylate peracid hydrolase|nr:isochorismatase family protein [Hyphomicrobiales bacterium]
MMVGSIKTDGLRLLKAKPEDITIDLAACAVIVVDMQNAYLSKGGYLDLAGFDRDGAEDVVIAMRHLLADARSADVPIIYLQNGWDPAYREAGGADSPNQMKSNALRLMRRRPELAGTLLAKGGWDYELRDEIAMQDGDILVQKSRYSGFVNTPLDSILRSRGIKYLLVAGVATNVCVETTIRDAFGLEYHAVLVTDCCHQAGPAYLQDATIYNVETFFGWTCSSRDIANVLRANSQR